VAFWALLGALARGVRGRVGSWPVGKGWVVSLSRVIGLILNCVQWSIDNPFEPCEPEDPGWIFFQGAQGILKDIFHSAYIVKEAVWKPLFADLVPEMFGRIQFRTVQRQINQVELWKDDEMGSAMPACPIEHHQHELFGMTPGDLLKK